MTHWKVKRAWRVVTGADDATTATQLSTVDLARFRCVVLLGAAGAGKTTEARALADHERAARCDVRERRLAEYADTSTELAGCLKQLAGGAAASTCFHLDALDEAMIPARGRWLAVKHWIEQDLPETGASIRITCRTAVWPKGLSDAIRGFCGSESFATAYLQPLTEEDVDAAAESTGIDPNSVRAQIDKARAQSLALHPLTLRMLLELSKDGDSLPSTLKDLFDKGVRILARDRQDRWEIGTQIPLLPDKIVDVAERLACHTILTGRETVNLGDDVPDSQLGLQDLSGRVAEDELRAVGSSGLCDSGAPETFRFAHRQFAEYLAGRRLARLPTHQSRAFLADPDGWRSGVAGPLRETAAFAAMFGTGLAAWLSSRDLEVVGLSDVADVALRRKATLGLLDRFRSGTLTAGELYRGGMELSGFQYEGAETDLRPVLKERGDRCGDVLECAISLIRGWRLSSMSDALADLVLDSTAPLHSRASAGYTLRECGTDAARKRLKPLVAGLPEDDHDELKGIALQCNWPDRLSTPELFEALTRRRRRSFFGAYVGFLHGLVEAEGSFDAGHVAAGLRWANGLTSEPSDTDPLHRFGMRIAHAALRDLDDPEIATGLVSLMRRWEQYGKSPLASLRKDPLEPSSNEDFPLYADRQARRRLIDRLAELVEPAKELHALAFFTPGLLCEEDFQWLLERGCDDGRTIDVRERCLQIAKHLPWQSRPGDVEAWLRVCDVEPVRKVLGNQKSVDLDSDQAVRLREEWEAIHGHKPATEAPKLDPSPRERVLHALMLSESEAVRFPNLYWQLTLEPTSTHYGTGRFLVSTPGWRDAEPGVRNRIVDAAKRYLSVETLARELSSTVAPNTFRPAGMAALWLVLERDPDWLAARSGAWWVDWCPYVLGESTLNMHGEPDDPKRKLVALLNETAASSVRREVLRLSSHEGADGRHTRLADALRLLAGQTNTELDGALCDALEAGAVQEEDIVNVTEFVLRRAKERSLPMCLRILENARIPPEGSRAEHVAVALLRNFPNASWTVLKTYLDADANRARRVLQAFAYDPHGPPIIGSVSTRQLGELAGMLLDLFPPDPDEDEGGVVGPVDAARLLRTRLISHLSSLSDEQSVDAFRRLDQQLGGRYPWLAGARIHAERAYHMTRWSSFPVDVIADVMDAETRRLLRSDEDVVDGIECALDRYAEELRQDGKESVEDLWNTPASASPSPKAEEHVSRKLCGVVRSYFRRYAVTADREVEIYRRSVSRADGGQPGSKVDVLVRVPVRGTTSGDAIQVPMEVKLSSNRQAKTGMQDQLVDRYMRQLGATHGVHVVVWMNTPDPERLRPCHRPKKWSCIEEARRDLEEEARRLSEERQVQIRAVVVDGSLR